MSNQVEIVKCYSQNTDVPMCRECKRSGHSVDNEYEVFNLKKDITKHYVCDGYVSKKESGSLFDE